MKAKKVATDWTRHPKQHCNHKKHPTKYATLAAAEAACIGLGAGCTGVYDRACDGVGDYYTCDASGPSVWLASSSSCIYTHSPTTPSPAPAPTPSPYPFYYGASTPAYSIPRTVTATPPAESVHFFPLSLAVNQGIAKTSDGKSVRIPLYAHLQAGYAKTQHNNQEWESGLSNLGLFTNDVSVMSDATGPAFFAEKTHATRRTGTPWGTASADGAKEVQEERSTTNQIIASNLETTRDYAIVAAAGALKFGDRLVESSTDETMLTRLRQYVSTKEGGSARIAQKKASATYTKLLSDAQAGRSRASYTEEVKSENRCFHFEAFEGLSSDGEHLTVPLDTNLVGMVGQVVFSPMRVFTFNIGTAFFTFDSARNALIIHYYVASHSFLPDQFPTLQPGYHPNLFIGPIDGVVPVGLADGRTRDATDPPSPVAVGLYMTAQALAADYERLYEDDLASSCTSSDLHGLGRKLQNGLRKDKEGGTTHAALWGKMLDAKSNADMVAAIAGSVDCAKMYLRSAVPYTTAFDFFELGVWGHFLAEQSQDGASTSLSSRFWDDGIKRQVGVRPPSSPAAVVVNKVVNSVLSAPLTSFATTTVTTVGGWFRGTRKRKSSATELHEVLPNQHGEGGDREQARAAGGVRGGGASDATRAAADLLRHHLREVTEEEWAAEEVSTKRSVERLLGEPFVPKKGAAVVVV